MMKTRLMTLAALFLGVAPALADDYTVTAPRVDKGETSIEAKINHNTDNDPAVDGYWSQVYGIEYGVTDFWATELAGEIEKDSGGGARLTNIKWENLLVPFRQGENWMDIGAELEIEKAAQDGEPNNFEAKLLLEKDVGDFENMANIRLNKEFGTNAQSGVGAGLSLRTAYRLDRKFEPGIEYYGDFGNLGDSLSFDEQEHVAGPVVKGKIGSIKYDGGVLFGVSDAAPDTVAKLNLEYEF